MISFAERLLLFAYIWISGLSAENHTATKPVTLPLSHDTHTLNKPPKVLCWVMTCPWNHPTKAKAVKETWGKRCDKTLFMSSKNDSSLGSIALPVEEGRQNLWAKTREAFKFIHKHFLNDFDWFLKADDDTFVIVENLKHFLQSKDPDVPIYFGNKFKNMVKQGYMSGGAGYILSREALKRFISIALANDVPCYKDNKGPEDVEMGRCMQSVNVSAGDSVDSNGKRRFCPMALENYVVPALTRSTRKATNGLNTLSARPISFHYINHKLMYALEYLIYQVKIN